MINDVQLKNFGPIADLDWQSLGKINLVIGSNGCGKTFLLKAMYSAVRALEEYKRGDEDRELTEILRAKLYWTFQPVKGNDLISKSEAKTLDFSLRLDLKKINYITQKIADNKAITILNNEVDPITYNSIFLPAKEILSVHDIILKSRELDKVFGFDDTYYDLAKAIRFPAVQPFELGKKDAGLGKGAFFSSHVKGQFSSDFLDARNQLASMIGGVIEMDSETNRWFFKQGQRRFAIGTTAEGIKKIAILDTLLGNGYLSENSIVFIDEPEANLHPTAIAKLLDIIAVLALHGIQFFLASHSYFVIKKLFLIAQEQKMSIPVLSKEGDSWQQSDLLTGMPDNSIIDESIRLYKEEVELAFK
ncbi:ATP-binding protein [Methylomonas paludis]|uniref:ATP-binding protein n=1 Tax=Methylomonas paludis TaxID=1173101 RepID=A0A975MMY2_9GAMM|nr:ATP-binding protein [Methylomonas paludis]QWF70589.1 ATP-binding protein [Methylomonas paludis]